MAPSVSAGRRGGDLRHGGHGPQRVTAGSCGKHLPLAERLIPASLGEASFDLNPYTTDRLARWSAALDAEGITCVVGGRTHSDSPLITPYGTHNVVTEAFVVGGVLGAVGVCSYSGAPLRRRLG